MSRGRALLAVVAATAFLTMLDNTVVTVAAPSIARELGVGLASLEWVATGYMLPYAGLLLAGGRLTDRYGTRRMLLAGLALLTAASLAAGRAGVAGGVFAVAREMSGVLGIAGVGAVVAARGDLAGGYRLGLGVAAALVAAGALIGARTLPGRGAGSGATGSSDAERAHQLGPGSVELPLPVRPGVGPAQVQVDGRRDGRG